jgi:hypothetical protein
VSRNPLSLPRRPDLRLFINAHWTRPTTGILLHPHRPRNTAGRGEAAAAEPAIDDALLPSLPCCRCASLPSLPCCRCSALLPSLPCCRCGSPLPSLPCCRCGSPLPSDASWNGPRPGPGDIGSKDPHSITRCSRRRCSTHKGTAVRPMSSCACVSSTGLASAVDAVLPSAKAKNKPVRVALAEDAPVPIPAIGHSRT